MWHNHSPGFEVLPNGDVLAVWFSSSTSGVGGEPVRTNARGMSSLLGAWGFAWAAGRAVLGALI